jgi:hypothetical protein
VVAVVHKEAVVIAVTDIAVVVVLMQVAVALVLLKMVNQHLDKMVALVVMVDKMLIVALTNILVAEVLVLTQEMMQAEVAVALEVVDSLLQEDGMDMYKLYLVAVLVGMVAEALVIHIHTIMDKAEVETVVEGE